MTVEDYSGKIRVLAGEVVSRIAAGEVVERPAAVVKELIDNSLDAGSTTIRVDVKGGGLGLIRVIDDGEGMSRTDATLAFQRHATSKLVSELNLSSIRTMGFRGEALPSIASVSKVKVVTACRHEPVGTQLLLDGGQVTEVHDIAAPQGTQVEVAALFFNTPARKKFLKAAATELAHISHVVQQASLARPTIQFHLTHNGQALLQFPAVASHRDRVMQVYHRRFVEHCRAVRGTGPGLCVEGFAISPEHARTSRSPQELFVNGRAVKNATVSHAVYNGYGSFLAKGRHPVFVLFLDVDPERVDVNVHPTKREVRFLDQDTLHREIRRAVRESLGAHPTSIQSTGLPSRILEGSAQSEVTVTSRPSPGGEPASMRDAGSRSTGWEDTVRQAYLPLASGTGLSEQGMRAKEPPFRYEAAPEVDVRPLGQVNRTFLVVQVGNELQVLDQHTAHERVLFERLQRAWAEQAMPSQPLLIPEPVELSPQGAALVEQHASELEKLGLLVEPFGSSSVVVRAVPAMLGRLDSASLVLDLVEDLGQWDAGPSLEAKVRPVLATLACHAAVRAGREMDLPEIKQLVEDWVREGFPATCPHGRRVALRLPTDELARIFGRG
jgi:DNA mismatch repair protein MutL